MESGSAAAVVARAIAAFSAANDDALLACVDSEVVPARDREAALAALAGA